ncbi:MAG TPA: glucose 1-dehydrogenase [Steroidobacteraceae bacterium]|nr:glucose 1-dehydrogenase [Steroidobacteraceae bacterium]
MAQLDFSGRTALVIGATEGIGRATALAFAAAGANVFAAGLGAERGRSLADEINALGGVTAEFMEADVASEAEMAAVVARAAARFGRIHAAVNNAGTEGAFGPVQDQSADDFDRLLAVNLKGVWHGLKYQLPHMLAHGGGAIVNTASSAGVQPIANIALYTASKHAVVGLTKATALEVARSNIRVNAVAPGPVNTGLLHRMVAGKIDLSAIAESVPMGRISEPEEIARAILWLCSDAASYITGHVLLADGGLTVG